MSKKCVVIGGGMAAGQFVQSLRQEGWEDDILVIGEEPLIPYHRPPLSKEFLAGDKTSEEIYMRPEKVYEDMDVAFRLKTRVGAIDRDNKHVVLDDGDSITYDRLCLCTGSRVRTLDVPGADLAGIHYLRSVADVEAIRADIHPGARAVIVGGGYIGLEAAAVLRRRGLQVTVLEAGDRVLQRVTAPAVSAFYTRVHSEAGVDIRCGIGVAGFEGEGRVRQVSAADGSRFEADLVIIGIGIVPNSELAAEAGLETDDGIIVDEYARTGDAGIVAAGDCTNHYNRIYDRRVRLESVQNAMDQARTAAATVCGNDKPYHSLPWFWSDQYDVKLQIAGLSAGYDDTVIRGDYETGRSFAVFYFRKGSLIAVDAVNRAAEFMAGKKLITAGAGVDPSMLADENVPMKDILKK